MLVEMRVRVLYFGVLTEAIRAREEALDVPEGTTVAAFLSILQTRSSNQPTGESGIWLRMAVAVNREYAQADVVLRDGDEVALLPPVSGGAV